MVRARFPGKPSKYFARKKFNVDVNNPEPEGCSFVSELIKNLAEFNSLHSHIKQIDDFFGFTVAEIRKSAKKAGEKYTIDASTQQAKKKDVPSVSRRKPKRLTLKRKSSLKPSSDKSKIVNPKVRRFKATTIKSNRLREKIKKENESRLSNEPVVLNDSPVDVEDKEKENLIVSSESPEIKQEDLPLKEKSEDVVEDKSAHNGRQFVLPSRSVHSSRVIKPNKRFIELPPPQVNSKRTKMSNSTKVILRKPKLKLKCESHSLEGPFSASNGQSLLTISGLSDEGANVSGGFLAKRVAPQKPAPLKTSHPKVGKTPKPTALRAAAATAGPRVKHVCRSASQVLRLASIQPKEVADTKSGKAEQTLNGKEQADPNKASDESCDEFDPSQNPEDTLNSYQPARRLQDLSIIGEEETADSKVSLDFWEPYDLDAALLQGLALLFPNTPSTPLPPLCFLCASAGPHPLDFCSICCEGYHWFCVPGGERTLRHRTEGGWRCPRCTPCHGCASVGATLYCSDCNHAYHPSCAAAAAGGVHPPPNAHHISWVCGECQKCSSCRQNDVEVWVGKLALCKPCFRLRKKGNFCPLCNVCYDNNDFDTKMVECGVCKRWIHAQCEDISDDKYHMLTYLPSDVDFVCRGCGSENGCAKWEGAIEKALLEGLKSVVKVLEKKESHLRREEDAGLLTPTDDAPSLRSVSARITSYSNVAAFDNDVTLAVPPALQPLARRTLKQTFPWYDAKLPSGPASLSTSSIAAKPGIGLKPQAPPQGPDGRVCLLCRSPGENGPGERLLYCGGGDWIHVNCAIWSNEVYEEVDGSLQNVYAAVSRSRLMRCTACRKRGASVGCCAKACPASFHFPCALVANTLLLESKQVFCANHAALAADSPLQKDFLILRSVYVELDRRKRRYVPKESAKLMVGSLFIENFGEIVEASDHYDILVPMGFQCSRLWWSSEDPGKLVRYRLKTFTLSEDERVNDLIDANFTIDHCGEFTPPPSPRHPVDDRDISAVLSQLVDTVCREPDPGDHLTRVLPPELEEAIFQDLPQDLIAGICLQDIFPDSQIFSTESVVEKIQKDTKCRRGREELNQVNLKCRLRSSMRLGTMNRGDALEAKSKSLVQVDGPADSDEDEEQPVKCGRCHRTYRNSDGYSRHLEQCSTESSSEGDTSEEEPPSPDPPSPVPESSLLPVQEEQIVHQEQCFTSSQIVASNAQCFSNDVMMGVDYMGSYQPPVQPVQVATAPIYPTLMIQPPVYPQLVLAPPPQPTAVYVNMETVVSNTILTSGQLVETSSYSTTTHLFHAEPVPQPETFVLVNNQPQIVCEPEVQPPDPIVLPAQHVVVPPPAPVLLKSEVLPPKPVNQVMALPPPKPVNQVAALQPLLKPTNRIAVRPLHRAKPVIPPPKPTNRVAAKPINVSIPESKPSIQIAKAQNDIASQRQVVPEAVKPVSIQPSSPLVNGDNVPKSAGTASPQTSPPLDDFDRLRSLPNHQQLLIQTEPVPKKYSVPVPVPSSLRSCDESYLKVPVKKPLENGDITKPFNQQPLKVETQTILRKPVDDKINKVENPLLPTEKTVNHVPRKQMNHVPLKPVNPVPSKPVNQVPSKTVNPVPSKPVNPVSSKPVNPVSSKPVNCASTKNSAENKVNGNENGLLGDLPNIDTKEEPKISYEITCDDGFTFTTDNITEAWEAVYEKVQIAREARGLEPLKENPFSDGDATLRRLLALGSSSVRYVVEQLPGVSSASSYKPTWHRRRLGALPAPPPNASGAARTEPIAGSRNRDMFSWLASRHRRPPPLDTVPRNPNSNRRAGSISLPMAMRYRHLKESAKRSVGVFRSDIHGRGLFCLRDIDAGEMVIEYAGEVIRSSLTDTRERMYSARGIGCYMFRIDDKQVVDATMKGNAARFINHSCEPNCYSRIIDILGKKHILIFALRRIKQGEELTYDYKFPLEDDKISCHCLSRRCRKYLN